ncbi:hypothetical protein AGOR_G00021850 [Albula goreensis]|uniref:Ig-like domain-containing protein n=1 Tax=Albula goreensis TaxID=1534307 RepID=A0A8T3E2T5_9TELE|nr:hypothetical protein AGOR_G00021850 [Albula goreensis]
MHSMIAVWTPKKCLSCRKLTLWVVFLCIWAGKVKATVVGKAGDVVFLHPSKQLKNSFEVKWKQSNRLVGKLKNGIPRYGSQYFIFPNSSLKINNTNRNDSGIYTLEVFDNNGKNIYTEEITLNILEFVSMPVVYASCTVDGRVKLTCSVGRGDEVTVHWIVYSDLSNHTINGTSAKHHTLYLGWQTPGYLVCVAGNRVSQKSSLRVTKTCRAHISSLMALGLFIACPTLAMAILKLKEKQPNEPRKDAEENVYIAMHGKKEIRAPPELDTSYYVSCGPPPTHLQEDVKEYTMELEDIYV